MLRDTCWAMSSAAREALHTPLYATFRTLEQPSAREHRLDAGQPRITPSAALMLTDGGPLEVRFAARDDAKAQGCCPDLAIHRGPEMLHA